MRPELTIGLIVGAGLATYLEFTLDAFLWFCGGVLLAEGFRYLSGPRSSGEGKDHA